MSLILDGSNGETFPSWTTAGRPASPVVGQMGYNTTIGQFDCYTSGGWVSVATTTSTSNKLTTSQMPTGSVLQVVNATFTTASSTTSTSFQQSNLVASITPTSSSSKILILCSFPVWGTYNGGDYCITTIYRGATNLGGGSFGGLSATASYAWGLNNGYDIYTNIMYLDSPATTSSTTYRMYFKSYAGQLVYVIDSAWTSSITLLEIAG